MQQQSSLKVPMWTVAQWCAWIESAIFKSVVKQEGRTWPSRKVPGGRPGQYSRIRDYSLMPNVLMPLDHLSEKGLDYTIVVRRESGKKIFHVLIEFDTVIGDARGYTLFGAVCGALYKSENAIRKLEAACCGRS